jgi:glutamate/tyrosine decarboxylase-like PLP-dependent enzyme
MNREKRELVATYRSVPRTLGVLLDGVDEAAASSRLDGEWSIAEVVCHLLDSEQRTYERVLRIRDEDRPYLPLFPDDEYRGRALAPVLAAFDSLRQEHAAVLEELDDAGWARQGIHGSRGAESILEMTRHATAHDAEHLAQIAEQLRVRAVAAPVSAPVADLVAAPPEADARERALRRAADLASAFLRDLDGRRVGPRADATEVAMRLGGELPDDGDDPEAVIAALAAAVDPGLVASAGPRYFGFVIGGAVPASVAADWLTAAWDQNAAVHASSPAAAGALDVACRWVLDLLGLPRDAGYGLTTGAGLANAVGLAAARHAVLQRAGWDVEADGLFRAPAVTVIISDEAHATVLTALQYLGLGRERVIRVATDDQGRMRADDLAEVATDLTGPTIVCIQSGNVNTGACDPADAAADVVASLANGWLHVDGAFGLWAQTSPELRHLTAGVERADSWATDAHKWLNVGYDCGFVAVRDRDAQRSAMSAAASYLLRSEGQRENWEWVLDSSHRARGFALYATIRSLGRSGIREIIEQCCALAQRAAERLAAEPGIEVLNEAVLNQVLVRFRPPDGGDADAFTRDVIGRVQADGTAWMGGTTWHGRTAMRLSVSNWSTTEADIDATVETITRAARA